MTRVTDDERLQALPLSGQLIDGRTAAKWLRVKARIAPAEVSLCSAFIRSEAIATLYGSVSPTNRGRVLVRWRLGDLLSGASDLDAYPLAKQLGFSFYIRQDFHGKVFSVPGSGIIVGSANATLSGFGLKETANQEVCTLVPDSKANQVLVDGLFDGAIEMTNSLFQEVTSVIKSSLVNTVVAPEWPSDLLVKLTDPGFSGRLLLSDCFVASPLINESGALEGTNSRDLSLLGVNESNATADSLIRAFQGTRVFRWLVDALESAGGELYFGALTESLHGALLDDPLLYRCDVKNVLQILLDWCRLLGGNRVLIDQPNYSQRVRLG